MHQKIMLGLWYLISQKMGLGLWYYWFVIKMFFWDYDCRGFGEDIVALFCIFNL